MKTILRNLMVLILLMTAASPAYSQKRKSNQQTPKTAVEKQQKALEQKQAQYQGDKNHHRDIQDKETRKRMNRNYKRAQKHSWGKDVPWYKRWFHKSKV